jgi:hypothetical protein
LERSCHREGVEEVAVEEVVVRGLKFGEDGGTQREVESWKRRPKARKRGMEQRIVSRIR